MLGLYCWRVPLPLSQAHCPRGSKRLGWEGLCHGGPTTTTTPPQGRWGGRAPHSGLPRDSDEEEVR